MRTRQLVIHLGLALCLLTVAGANALAQSSTTTAKPATTTAKPATTTTKPATSTATAKPATTTAAAKTDLNSASKADLMKLAGVGDVIADKIIAGRPFARKDELVQKKILSQSAYDKIKDEIIATQPKTSSTAKTTTSTTTTTKKK